MTRSLKSHFSRTLGRQGAPVHFAAHSHHPWPDATFDAQVAYWEDSARDLDQKWEKVFSQVIPEAQRHIAGHLGLPRGDTLCFSPNTHDFLLRILWSLQPGKVWRVITTDSEFPPGSGLSINCSMLRPPVAVRNRQLNSSLKPVSQCSTASWATARSFLSSAAMRRE